MNFHTKLHTTQHVNSQSDQWPNPIHILAYQNICSSGKRHFIGATGDKPFGAAGEWPGPCNSELGLPAGADKLAQGNGGRDEGAEWD